MPFKEDPNVRGSNADGSLSDTYCSYCYVDGAFTQPAFTATDMQVFVKGKLKELGFFHRIMAPLFIKGIPKLARWNKA
jgi:hypothetical protein